MIKLGTKDKLGILPPSPPVGTLYELAEVLSDLVLERPRLIVLDDLQHPCVTQTGPRETEEGNCLSLGFQMDKQRNFYLCILEFYSRAMLERERKCMTNDPN